MIMYSSHKSYASLQVTLAAEVMCALLIERFTKKSQKNRRRTDNIIAERRRTNRQTTIFKILNRKLYIQRQIPQ